MTNHIACPDDSGKPAPSVANGQDRPGPKPEPLGPVTSGSPETFAEQAKSLRRKPANLQAYGKREVLKLVPVRKPDKDEWFRTHPDQDLWFDAYIYEDKGKNRDDGGRSATYIVTDDVAPQFGLRLLKAVKLVPTVTDFGTLILWPIRVPKEDGRVDGWMETAEIAALEARTEARRIEADQALGGYRIFEPTRTYKEPDWPGLFTDRTIDQVVEIAFRGKIIDSPDHEICLRLRLGPEG